MLFRNFSLFLLKTITLKVSREIKAAILVIASILLFIWGYQFLKGKDLFTNYKTLYVRYDNVEGLPPSAAVTLNGFIIGKVTKITLDHKTGQLLVELQIKSDFPISKSSEVNIYEPGFIGGKQIQVVPNFSDPAIAEDGDFMQGRLVPGLVSAFGEQIAPLTKKIESMVVSADTVLTNLNSVLDKKMKADLKNSIANLNATLSEFRAASAKVNGIVDQNQQKIGNTMGNLETASANFSKISDTLANANIGETIRKLEYTLADVNRMIADMQSGKGTMGKLMKDETLYKNLSRSSQELELLLQDLRLNPTRYINISVFGKKNKPYKAPVVLDTITN
jgi:phospholipid/cholesterol/gamma-HCH transport system substrate-binding protein